MSMLWKEEFFLKQTLKGNNMKYLLIIAILILNLSFAFADGDHSAPATADGAAKLLEDGEFTLTPAAEKRLGIKWLKLEGSGPWKVPVEAIVKIKFTKAAYRKFEGRITLVVLDKVNREGKIATVSSPDLQAGDLIAVSGVKYIRLAEVDISSGTVDNCSH